MNKQSFFTIARATSTIEVEGLGTVHCRELSAGAVSSLSNAKTEMDILASVLLSGVTTEDGKPMFTNADKNKILDMPLAPLQQIAEEIMSLTGLEAGEESGEESPKD